MIKTLISIIGSDRGPQNKILYRAPLRLGPALLFQVHSAHWKTFLTVLQMWQSSSGVMRSPRRKNYNNGNSACGKEKSCLRGVLHEIPNQAALLTKIIQPVCNAAANKKD